MTGNEIEELNEIRQGLDGVLIRVDRAYNSFNMADKRDEGFNNLVQASKILLHIKSRMEILATCNLNRNPHASDSGAFM